MSAQDEAIVKALAWGYRDGFRAGFLAGVAEGERRALARASLAREADLLTGAEAGRIERLAGRIERAAKRRPRRAAP